MSAPTYHVHKPLPKRVLSETRQNRLATVEDVRRLPHWVRYVVVFCHAFARESAVTPMQLCSLRDTAERFAIATMKQFKPELTEWGTPMRWVIVYAIPTKRTRPALSYAAWDGGGKRVKYHVVPEGYFGAAKRRAATAPQIQRVS